MVSMASENTFQTYLFCFDNSYKKDNYKPSESNTHTHTHTNVFVVETSERKTNKTCKLSMGSRKVEHGSTPTFHQGHQFPKKATVFPRDESG